MQRELLTGKRGYPTLVVDAASFFIGQGELTRAVELLEQGTALLWLQLRGLRETIDDFANVNSELAVQFKDANNKLEALSSSALHISFVAGGGVDRTDDRRKFDALLVQSRQLSERRKVIIDRIRLVPGFEDFQRPTPVVKLQEVAAEGPVIILNHSEYRSDALIVLHNQSPIVVPLSEDNPGFYEKIWQSCTTICQVLEVSAYLRFPKPTTNYPESCFVLKVVKKLAGMGIEEGSRILWCPTSMLQSLPFHASAV